MRFIDKLLLLLLILLLPAGVFVSARFFNKDEATGMAEASPDQVAKVEQLIEKLSQAGSQDEEDKDVPNIQLTSVSYASKSAVLTLAGIAPSSSLPVRLSWTEIKDDAVIAELGADEDNGTVLLPVSTRTFVPRSDGSFSILLPVSIEHGLVDIAFEQGVVKKVVLYDLDVLKIREES